MPKTFGELVAEALDRKGWSDYQLTSAIGLLPGDKAFNPTQVRRLKRGERRNLSRPLVARLIELLELDPITAWHAAGLWPEGVDPQDVTDLSERRAARIKAANRAASLEGARAATSSRPDLGRTRDCAGLLAEVAA